MNITAIANKLTTKDEADELIGYLSDLRDSLTVRLDTSQANKLDLPAVWREGLVSVIQENGLDTASISMSSTFLTDLIQSINKLAVIDVKTAVDLPDDLLGELSVWLSEQAGYKVLVNPQKDPKIVAGAIVSYKGYYKDYSLKSKLDGILAAI